MGGDGKGSGKGKAVPRAPPDPAGKEKLKAKQAAAKAEAEEGIRLQKEMEQKQKEFGAKIADCRSCGIDGIDWAKAKTTYHLVGGKGTLNQCGVTAVLLDEDQVVCVRTQDCAREMVALAVANCIGVRVAQFRMLHCSEDPQCEWQLVDQSVQRLSPGWAQHQKELPRILKAIEDAGNKDAYEKYLKGARMSKAVLEFIPGNTFASALSEKTTRVKVMDEVGFHYEWQASQTTPTPEMFGAIGRICALDLLLNNMDRVPLPVWDNALGNLSNIMVGTDGAIVGIDQQVNLIAEEEGTAEYLQRVSHLVKHLMRNEFAHMKVEQAATKVEQAILEVSGVEVSTECLQAMLHGMREGLISFEQQWANGALEATLMEASEATKLVQDTATVSGEDLVSFVRKVAEVVAPLVREEGRKESAS